MTICIKCNSKNVNYTLLNDKIDFVNIKKCINCGTLQLDKKEVLRVLKIKSKKKNQSISHKEKLTNNTKSYW
jgi:hypothetical protein